MTKSGKPLNFDDDGQPMRGFAANLQNNTCKAFDQLSGICRGMLADGEINDQEAQFFREWLKHYSTLDAGWALDAVIQRVRRIYEDGVVTVEERGELKEIMEQIVGDVDSALTAAPKSTVLPFDDPPPPFILFKDRYFCITGKFAYGTRQCVFETIETRGGIPSDATPKHGTHYMVIGTFASRDWINTNYGRKIERGIELRQKNSGIQIIGEDHWRKFLS
jgi:hypothetical protein